MDDSLPLPNDLAACKGLMAKLAARIREIEAASTVRKTAAHDGCSQSDAGSSPLAVQVAPQTSSIPSPLNAPLPVPHHDVQPLTLTVEDLAAQLRDRDARLEEMARVILELQQARLSLEQENEKLQLTLLKLWNRIYGTNRERFIGDPTQQTFDFGDEPQAEDAFQDAVEDARKVVAEIEARRQAKKPAPKGRSETFPEHLERVERIVDVPDDQKACATHGPRTMIGYDQTETLKLKRPELYVEVRKYPKYACPGKSDCGVRQAERPVGLMAGNRFDTSVAAEIITQKYAFHLPFYRQQDWFAASGWTPTRSTLLNILAAAETVLKPLTDYYRLVVQTSPVIGCDDTTVTLIVPQVIPDIDPLNPRSRRIHEVFSKAVEANKPSVTARMWAYRGLSVPLNVFDFTVSRHRDGPDEVLEKYTGTLLGDCWWGFEQIRLDSDLRITRAACWAHARRKVFEGRSSHPLEASALLAVIQQLYDIEDRGKSLLTDGRLALRQREAVPLLNKIRALLDSVAYGLVLPKSSFAKALGYLRNHWQALLVYTTDGLVPIDNNDVEQLMKQVATGRKNWLFTGSVEAGNRAATLLTLISSAVRHDLDVGAYLKEVLDQLLAGSTDYESMRADLWKQSHPEHVRVYRQEERQEASDRRIKRRALRRIPQTPEGTGNSPKRE